MLAGFLVAGAGVASAQVCGDGILDPGEACDDGNTLDGDCCSGLCQIEPSSVVCRAAVDACDVAESCTGVSPTCPADAVASAGTQCRAAAGLCDVAEVCDGVGTACPTDTLVNAGTVCRASAGACDVAESCTGSDPACPTDTLVNAGTVCRASAGACDVAESCTGANAACPADTLVSAGTVCRAAAGACDTAESCTGASPACPTDKLVGAGTVCRASTGVCDAAETCSGANPACPADVVARAGTICRASTGVCDAAEVCDGVSNLCGADLFAPNGKVCTDDGQVCTADRCSSGVCTHTPGNAGVVCRTASGACDVAEVCDGTSGSCPPDVKAADGATCSDGQSCSINDQCQGGVCSGASSGCGDGFVSCGEECDDGNTTSGDGCSATCHIEARSEVCGDLIDNEPDGKFDCDDSDCTCAPLVNGGTHARVSRLIIRRNMDVVRLKGAVHPTTSFDPTSEKFGLLITNANGRVFSVVVPAGKILTVGKGTWVYRSRLAKVSGGMTMLKLHQATAAAGTVLRFSIVATGELTGATLPAMTTEIVVGDDVSAQNITWTQLRSGFKTELP